MIFTELFWSAWRLQYESGKFASIDDLYAKTKGALKSLHGRIPKLETLRLKASRGEWKRGLVAIEAEKTERQKMIEYAASLNFLPHKEALDGAKKLIEATNDQGKPVYVAIRDGINALNKMFGLNAPEKTEADIKSVAETNVTITINDRACKI